MKEYEIWLGYYHLGQGYHPPSKPEMAGKEKASSFKLACLKHELRNKLKIIEEFDKEGRYWGDVDFTWWWNPKTNSNGWTGSYYKTEEDAWKSFKI